MGRDEDARPDDVEFLDDGPQASADVKGRAPIRWSRWLPVLLAGAVAATVITAIVHHESTPSAAPSRSGSSAPSVAVTDVHHGLLGVTAGWELFARGDGVLVRIELARGRITSTTLPALASTGPVSFLVSDNEAIIRPIDYVPGYVVPDGHPGRPATAALSNGGPVLPGPDPDHVWVQSKNSSPAAMGLAALDNSTEGRTLSLPAGTSMLQVLPDGAGNLLIPTTGGTLDARADGTRRITTGSVVAAGSTGWLVLECDRKRRCVNAVIDRATGARRIIDVRPTVRATGGVISPDGRTAAVLTVAANSAISLSLVDLATGNTSPLHLPGDPGGHSSGIAWSPDSRWLFATDAAGTISAISAETGLSADLGVRLPPVQQLAVRNVTN